MNLFRVYLSASPDLRDEREAVRQELERLGVSVITWETITLSHSLVTDMIQKQIENADGFIQLAGFTTGTKLPPDYSTPNATTGFELEAKTALRIGKPAFLFFASDRYLKPEIPQEKIETAIQYRDLLKAGGYAYYSFDSRKELITRIFSLNIGEYIKKGRESVGFRIFLSYRRQEPISLCVTHRLHEKLIQEFGLENIFLDTHSIPLGTDYRAHLDASVADANFMFAIIGPDWVETLHERQSEDAPDFVRQEIGSAIKLKIPVAPIRLGDTPDPSEVELPEDMRFLAVSQGFRIRVGKELFTDINSLISKLKEYTEEANRALEPDRSPAL